MFYTSLCWVTVTSNSAVYSHNQVHKWSNLSDVVPIIAHSVTVIIYYYLDGDGASCIISVNLAMLHSLSEQHEWSLEAFTFWQKQPCYIVIISVTNTTANEYTLTVTCNTPSIHLSTLRICLQLLHDTHAHTSWVFIFCRNFSTTSQYYCSSRTHKVKQVNYSAVQSAAVTQVTSFCHRSAVQSAAVTQATSLCYLSAVRSAAVTQVTSFCHRSAVQSAAVTQATSCCHRSAVESAAVTQVTSLCYLSLWLDALVESTHFCGTVQTLTLVCK